MFAAALVYYEWEGWYRVLCIFTKKKKKKVQCVLSFINVLTSNSATKKPEFSLILPLKCTSLLTG